MAGPGTWVRRGEAFRGVKRDIGKCSRPFFYRISFEEDFSRLLFVDEKQQMNADLAQAHMLLGVLALMLKRGLTSSAFCHQ